ncbi:MAG: M14 family metallopeptidase [Chloroflexota bacterium]
MYLNFKASCRILHPIAQYCRFVLLIILTVIVLSACDAPSSETLTLPTVARFPTRTITPIPSATVANSQTPYPTVTPTMTPTFTLTPTATDIFTATITSTLVPSLTPTATPLPESFVFGTSVEGRQLIANRVGTGEHIILLVGGIHAGFESNTITLVQQLQRHYENNPAEIASDVTFLFVPVLNPDGEARGRVLNGRFNGNDVDLNRNWGCGWSPDAVFGQGTVNPGTEAFSEPESTALGSLIERLQPAVAIFYHSAANGVFAGGCEGEVRVSDALAEVYGEASGYSYGNEFEAYPVTGTAPAWIDSIGIPALDVELATAEGTELSRNLTAVMAVQAWVGTQDE